ncbi:MAG: XRE family transcriptional regulator, partial [Anaerolineae bacterium]|nr:XRE family transcriptional regulator [Anaerolineae bacterium]
GFGGGKGAFAAMGETYGVHLPEEQAEKLKKKWRAINKPTVDWWYELERAAIAAVENPGRTFRAGMIPWKMRGSFLFCRLPSGRLLSYPYPEIHMDPTFGKPCLTYKTVPSPMMKLWPDKSNSGRWARVPTFGGKLAENVTQALCRDVLVEKMLRLEEEGFPVVLHVHDEVVTEGCFSEPERVRFQTIMEEPVSWAPDMPIQAEAWLAKRYIK